MPIREFSPRGVPRAKIAFFETLPAKADLKRFEERRFDCVPCTASELGDPSFVGLLDAVIFSQKSERRRGLGEVLRTTIPQLLNNGLCVYVRIVADPAGTPYARSFIVDTLLQAHVPMANLQPAEQLRVPKSVMEREGGMLAPYVYLVDSATDWVDLAHTVCDHPAGNAPNTELQLDGYDLVSLGPDGHEERLLLLQRAFSDCKTVHLQPMADGLSGARVFKAYASLGQGLVGGWPYLQFVKLGPRQKIVEEYDNYIGCALDYVPFHLGPRLRLDRCNLGSSWGILVGDFVEGAEPIRDAAPTGRAGHAIANLFDKTLGAWRKQAREDSHRNLAQHLERKWLDEQEREIEVPASRQSVVRQLGGNPDVTASHRIFDRHAASRVLCGPAHGDLHATNVLVRGGDAIIIDFEKMKDALPILYDPASLEAGLLVDGFRDDPRAPEELLASISDLYRLEVLQKVAKPCHAADPSSWFYDCAGQIRTLSRYAELSPGQYALVLALCLIRKGCNPDDFRPAQENLRAISFVLGQRILAAIDRAELSS